MRVSEMDAQLHPLPRGRGSAREPLPRSEPGPEGTPQASGPALGENHARAAAFLPAKGQRTPRGMRLSSASPARTPEPRLRRCADARQIARDALIQADNSL